MLILVGSSMKPSVYLVHIIIIMSEKEEEFPFQQFVEALADQSDLKGQMKEIIAAIGQKNVYWAYSAFSTILQILKTKQEDPYVKCRCLEASTILFSTSQYSIVTLVEVYLLPVIREIAHFKGRKSGEMQQYYFQQTYNFPDSPEIRKQSQQFIERSTELIFMGSIMKPYRTVETDELKQQSIFTTAAKQLLQKGVKQPQKWKWVDDKNIKTCRKGFLDKLKKFKDQSQSWAQFLLVNLLQQIKLGKKQLLQLKLLLSYGESYLTSPVINICEDQLTDLSEDFHQKKRYLGLLNQLVRYGDLEAIIMIKNSQFFPAITSRIGGIQGHLGINQGELLFPQISASKQVKKQFYCDFLRCLENWAKSMPSDYDSQDFSIALMYKYLKDDKKFKFPDNLHIARYEKQTKDNLAKNKERNDKLVQILERLNSTSKQPSISVPFSQKSHIDQKPTLSANELEIKLKQAQKQMKNLLVDPTLAQEAFKMLNVFKDAWIGYLQSLNLEEADQEQLQTVVNAGQKCVQQIQLIVPIGNAFIKGKMTYKDFKQRVAESLQFHHDVSRASNNGKKSNSLSRSLIKSRNSGVTPGQFNKSRIAGRQLRQKIKQKGRSRNISRLNMSKAIDRSNISKYTSRSRANNSRFTENSKFTQKSRVKNFQSNEKSQFNKIQSQIDEEINNFDKVEVKTIQKKHSLADQISVNKSNRSRHQDNIVQFQTMGKEKSYASHRGSQKSKSKYEIQQVTEKFKHVYQQQSISNKDDDFIPKKFAKIEDYEIMPQKTTSKAQPRQSSLRKNSSRILLRQGNRGSKLNESKDSVASEREQSGLKPQKSKSLKRSVHLEMNRTKKVSEIQSQLKRNVIKGDQTIQLNGNMIKKGSSIDNNKNEANEVSNFKDGPRQISSIIHSNGRMSKFHNSAENILDLQNKVSEIKQPLPKLPSQMSNKSVSKAGERQMIKVVQISKQSSRRQRNQEESDPQDMINTPQLLPMRHSFHKNTELKSMNKAGQVPLFKQIFSNRYQGIQARQKEQKFLRNNSGLKNIIKSKSKQKQGYDKNSIVFKLGSDRRIQSQKQLQSPRAHLQYGQYYQSSKNVELQELQIKKNLQIEQLRQKIKQLQMQTLTMRTKLVAKDNELKSLKSGSVAGSQRGFAHFTSPALSNHEKTSLSRSEKGSIRGSSISKRGEMSQFQKQIQSGFKQYLQKIKGSSIRKSLLKLKCLIHKSDQLQIGCLSQTGQMLLESTLYITSHRFDLSEVAITVLHDNCLKIKASPTQIKSIPQKRQQKIHLTIQVIKVPFCLPEIQINYKANSEYSSSYHRFALPLAFNKFCQIQPQKFQVKSSSYMMYIRTDDFKLNQKVVKLQKLGDSLGGYLIVPPIKQRLQWLAFSKCKYAASQFNICLNLGQKYSWIQGFLLNGDKKAMNFFICTMKEILDASKK